MGKLLYALAAALVGAGLVHIVIVLAVPAFSDRDAWSGISGLGAPYEFTEIATGLPARTPIHLSDPLFRTATCHFDLSEGPVHVTAGGNVPFWSVSIFSGSGVNIFSNNDRTSPANDLDILVINPVDALEFRKNLPAGFERSITVEADIDAGFAVLRVFQPDESWRTIVAGFLQGAACNPA